MLSSTRNDIILNFIALLWIFVLLTASCSTPRSDTWPVNVHIKYVSFPACQRGAERHLSGREALWSSMKYTKTESTESKSNSSRPHTQTCSSVSHTCIPKLYRTDATAVMSFIAQAAHMSHCTALSINK